MGVSYVGFPGLSGSFLSSDDTNLLDADTAHCYQSIGRWESRAQSDTLTQETGVAEATVGGNVLQWLAASPAGNASVRTNTGTGVGFDLAVSTQYSASIRARTLAGVDRTAKMGIEVRNNTTYVGGAEGSTDTLPSDGSWVTLPTATYTTPSSGFDNGGIHLIVTDAADNDEFQIDVSIVREGSDGTFVPSTRIVGDLDFSAKVAAADYSTGAVQMLVDKRSGNSGFNLLFNATGDVYARHGDGADVRGSALTPDVAFVDGQVYEIRRTFEGGSTYLFVDGAQQVSSTTYSAGDADPSSVQVGVGARYDGATNNTAGDFYWAEVRDGIGGPVVWRFDAADIPKGDFVDPGYWPDVTDYHTITRNGSLTLTQNASGYVQGPVTGWSLQAVNLRSLGAYNIATINGWDVFAGMRGDPVSIPYRHGSKLYGQRWLNQKVVLLQLVVMDRDPATGAITHALGPRGHIQENIDNLLTLFYSQAADLDLRRTLPDGTVRQALCMVDGEPIFSKYKNTPHHRLVTIPLLVPSGRWNELPVNQTIASGLDGTGPGGDFDLVVGGNAPVDDFTMTFDTFSGDVTDLTIDFPDGEQVVITGTLTTGDTLTLDFGERTADLNGSPHDAALTATKGWWAQLAAAVTHDINTTATTAATYTVTVDWYDQWL